jgi:uncharacterized protein
MRRDDVATARTIAPQSAIAIRLARGLELQVIDPSGEQVADLTAVSMTDVDEIFSAGRTIDYNGTTRVTVGHQLYSNRSRAMFTITADDVGVHDLLLAPCSAKMFEILRGQAGHPNCLDNIAGALRPFGVRRDAIDSTLNIFMDVKVQADGSIRIEAPASRAGQRIVLRAEADLVVAVAACSSEVTNNGTCKAVSVLYG